MKKSTVLLIILFTILVGITIRVFIIVHQPTPHEMGIDSFFYHKEANVLLTYHSFTWWLNPLSLWGLYPYSDSPGGPTYVAEISALSGLSVESSILIYDLILIILGGEGMYIFSLKINRKIIFPFTTTFVFLLAPLLFMFTVWSLGEREFLVYFLPFLSLIVINIINKNHPLLFSIFLLIPTLFVMSTIHLISVFVYGLIIAPIVIFIVRKITPQKMKLYTYTKHYLKPTSYIIITLILIYMLFILNVFVNLPKAFSIENYKQTAIFTGTNPLIIIANIGVSLSGAVGILYPIFFPIGFLWVIFKRRNTIMEKYILWGFLLTLPILVNRLYSRPAMVFLSTLFVGCGTFYLFKKIDYSRLLLDKKRLKNYLKIVIVVILLLSSSVFTIWYYEYREKNTGFAPEIKITPYARETTYQQGVYQKVMMRGVWIGNNWMMDQRIQAYSNKPLQPGIYNSGYDPVFYKLVNRSILKIHYSKRYFEYTSRPYVSDYYFEQRKDYLTFFYYSKNIEDERAHKIILKYNIHYLIIDKEIKYRICEYAGKTVSKSLSILQTLDDYAYKIYENDRYSSFLI